jgi:hypothetical protein
MNRTFTPRLEPAVLDRLEAYADRFRPPFNHPRQALWSGVYLRGLIQEGERKSIEPLSRRVSLPAELARIFAYVLSTVTRLFGLIHFRNVLFTCSSVTDSMPGHINLWLEHLTRGNPPRKTHKPFCLRGHDE